MFLGILTFVPLTTNARFRRNTMVFNLKHHGVQPQTPRCSSANTAVFILTLTEVSLLTCVQIASFLWKQ